MNMEPYIVQPHIGGGVQKLYRFENGYGASVIPEYDFLAGGYKTVLDKFEILKIKWDDDTDFDLIGDPIRFRSWEEIETILTEWNKQ